jgi:hypothetical protein
MGGNQSSEVYSNYSIRTIQEDYRCIGERTDCLYGHIQVFAKKTEEEEKIYSQYRVFQSKQEHSRFLEILNKRMKLDN